MIILNPHKDEVVQTIPESGCVIITDLIKVPNADIQICGESVIPPIMNPQTSYASFNNNSVNDILPNIERSIPEEPKDCHKYYSLTPDSEKKYYKESYLKDLAIASICLEGDIGEDPDNQRSSILPALFTYIGQFLDHDLSKQTLENFTEKINADEIKNERCALLNLESVFKGKAVYDENCYLVLEKNKNDILDVPRNDQGIQILGDTRNGENQITLQFTMIIMKYYNKVLKQIHKENPDKCKKYCSNLAKQTTIFHWQYIITHEFLQMACGPYYTSLFNEYGEPNFDIIKPKNGALNIEFSFAAYRWHSLVQEAYYANAIEPIDEHPIISNFKKPNFNGFTPLSGEIEIDFGFFWPMQNYNGFQQAHLYSNMLAFPLAYLPEFVVQNGSRNIMERTLLRQNQLGMASGQYFAELFGILESDIIKEIKIQNPNFLRNCILSQEKIKEVENYFYNDTPLFFYIMYEAYKIGQGCSLGPLGAKICGLTILAQLFSDPNSYVYHKFSPKKNKYGCKKNNVFTVENLINYANDTKNEEHIFKPDLFTNFFKPNENFANSESVKHNFQHWELKIISTLTKKDVGKKLKIVNNLKNKQSNMTILIYNRSQTAIIETITIDFNDRVVNLVWDEHAYKIDNDIN